jgi:hypothetical protein
MQAVYFPIPSTSFALNNLLYSNFLITLKIIIYKALHHTYPVLLVVSDLSIQARLSTLYYERIHVKRRPVLPASDYSGN